MAIISHAPHISRSAFACCSLSACSFASFRFISFRTAATAAAAVAAPHTARVRTTGSANQPVSNLIGGCAVVDIDIDRWVFTQSSRALLNPPRSGILGLLQRFAPPNERPRQYCTHHNPLPRKKRPPNSGTAHGTQSQCLHTHTFLPSFLPSFLHRETHLHFACPMCMYMYYLHMRTRTNPTSPNQPTRSPSEPGDTVRCAVCGVRCAVYIRYSAADRKRSDRSR